MHTCIAAAPALLLCRTCRNDGSPVGPLARRSYELHRQLAEQFGAEAIGYREVDTLQVCSTVCGMHACCVHCILACARCMMLAAFVAPVPVQVVGQASPRRAQVRGKSAPLPGWLDGNISACSRLGSKSTTAQVRVRVRACASYAEQAAAGLAASHACCLPPSWPCAGPSGQVVSRAHGGGAGARRAAAARHRLRHQHGGGRRGVGRGGASARRARAAAAADGCRGAGDGPVDGRRAQVAGVCA